jgi:SAM-dependent methyltransferase
LNTLHQMLHGKPENQEPSDHTDHSDHPDQHQHPHHRLRGLLGGFRMMGLLGILPLLAHDQDWLSNYRPSRLLPASNKVIVATILVLLVGILLPYILPSSSAAVAVTLIVLAVAHLSMLVLGGLIIALVVRRIRSQVRHTVIDSITWRGTEQVLDVGCGTGMLLNGCARQLKTGKAVGIDLWQEPIAGSRNILLDNAKAEGVLDKIDYRVMDARHLRFEDATFDVIVSSAALHHIGSQRQDREQAVAEMIRVLKPGGVIALADVSPMIEIAESVILRAGLQFVRRDSKYFFRFITASKPA